MRFEGSTIWLYAGAVVAFGVLVPWLKGVEFLDPTIVDAYACLGVVFAGPAAAQKFERTPGSLAEALGAIGAAVMFGEAIALAMLGCGLLTIYATHRGPAFFGLDLQSLAGAAFLGLTGAFAVAALAAWTTLQFSANVTRMVLRAVLLGLLAAFFLRSRWLPAVAWRGAEVSVAAFALFLLLLRVRLRRS